MPRALHYGAKIASPDCHDWLLLPAGSAVNNIPNGSSALCHLSPAVPAVAPGLIQLFARRTNHHAEAHPVAIALSAHLQAWRSSSTVRLSSPSSWISRSSSCRDQDPARSQTSPNQAGTGGLRRQTRRLRKSSQMSSQQLVRSLVPTTPKCSPRLHPGLALISCRCRRSRPRKKASVPKGWMPTNRQSDTSCTLQRTERAAREGGRRVSSRSECCGGAWQLRRPRTSLPARARHAEKTSARRAAPTAPGCPASARR